MSSSTSAASTGSGAGGGGGNHSYFVKNAASLGFGYVIAIFLGFLVFISSVVLASYVFCLARTRTRPRSRSPNSSGADPPNPNAVILPRIIFVAEDGGNEVNVVGLDQTVINSYTKFPFCKSRDRGSGDSMCSICLCDYKDGEMLRMMPDCRHLFHLCCIDAWLRLNASCPVCRNSPLPTPLSTPLSEIVPLSQYPGDRRR
ncbi:hypothetical protein NE237_030279 [Protea cynaroides]|uniref:RING-type domain-containing protein n=1 Tax=Protea cynaroides TaxID=273540 RepID=A0A9Q0JVX2_9MAGN|nr:hypothetical protein NE237_030279 [Protea cynaroides]